MPALEGRHLHGAARIGGPPLERIRDSPAMPPKRTTPEGRAPKTFPRRLTDHPPQVLDARARDLTVMFTDIVGFTRLAEALAPAEVAGFLVAHFELLAAQIERGQGTIDRVLGDGLLAFWDIMEGYPAPAAPALRTAVAIRAAVEADNAARAARGLAPVRLRVGLHTGPLVTAPLDAAGRLGVTLFGDAVNVAQRLEDAARHVMAGETVTIVASDAVVTRAGRGFRFERLGELPVRGRQEPVRAFRLVGMLPAETPATSTR
jgi:adenylate cyclase